MAEEAYHIYILRCGDGSYYTGISKDVDKRLEQHRENKGARYTRGRGPLELVYAEKATSHGQALIRERAIKTLPRDKKQALIKNSANKLPPKTPQKTPQKAKRGWFFINYFRRIL